MTTDDKLSVFAAIANGENLSDACEGSGIPVREVAEAIVTDAGFAAALLVAQKERELRKWRALDIDLSRIQSACEEAASNAGTTYSAIEDLHTFLAAGRRD